MLEASREVPVIVDFWAPWCGPCKQLGPLLEKIVTEAKGAVKMVKVNIDENQEIAQQLRIQSIPAVFAFKNGQPVDGFMGAIPESQVRDFVAGLAGGEAGRMAAHDHADEVLAVADEAFEAGDRQAQRGASLCPCAAGRTRPSQGGGGTGALLPEERRPGAGEDDAAAGAARCGERRGGGRGAGRAEAARAGGGGGRHRGLDAAKAKLAADPGDHQARYDLALALDAKGDREGAIAQLLDIVRRDRKWNEDAARQHLVTLFEAMGPADPRTIAARRQLSSILFS